MKKPLVVLAVGVAGVAWAGHLPGTRSTRTQAFDGRAIEYADIAHGPPTVVFEHGLAGSMGSWEDVFTEIGKSASVFAYHRPGYGHSSPPTTPRDGAHVVDELRELLRRTGHPPPYVLVGHSLGGLYLQLFARKYPAEVVGLVLVDSLHPTQFDGAGAIAEQPPWFRAALALFVRGDMRRELAAVRETGRQVLALPTVTDKPVVVLSARDPSTSQAARFANQKRADLARLYPHSEQVWLDCGHNIQNERPRAVIDAIRRVLARTRRAGP